jgi:hypothetical protein
MWQKWYAWGRTPPHIPFCPTYYAHSNSEMLFEKLIDVSSEYLGLLMSVKSPPLRPYLKSAQKRRGIDGK